MEEVFLAIRFCPRFEAAGTYAQCRSCLDDLPANRRAADPAQRQTASFGSNHRRSLAIVWAIRGE
jgi:hypothetical protein